jgi:hypothetical protein
MGHGILRQPINRQRELAPNANEHPTTTTNRKHGEPTSTPTSTSTSTISHAVRVAFQNRPINPVRLGLSPAIPGPACRV